jgi:type III secretion protein Q
MALPFDLPVLSRGFAELTPTARAAGAEVLAASGRAVGAVLGEEVAIQARVVPGLPGGRAFAARMTIDLAGLPGTATLEVEPALVVRVVDRLAGGTGDVTPAAALTPIEATALELAALSALDAAAAIPAVEAALAPRLARGGPEPISPLAVELEVTAGPIRGRARLLVPAAALRALAGAPEVRRPDLALPVSLRGGTAALSLEDLDALEPGDVVVLDPPEGGLESLVVPGGLRIRGRFAEEGFHVEEIQMSRRMSELPVLLEVELAQVEVTLADLARLEPGNALPIALDRRGIVTLRVGGRAVARGELVDVEGAIGVRVLSVEVVP